MNAAIVASGVVGSIELKCVVDQKFMKLLKFQTIEGIVFGGMTWIMPILPDHRRSAHSYLRGPGPPPPPVFYESLDSLILIDNILLLYNFHSSMAPQFNFTRYAYVPDLYWDTECVNDGAAMQIAVNFLLSYFLIFLSAEELNPNLECSEITVFKFNPELNLILKHKTTIDVEIKEFRNMNGDFIGTEFCFAHAVIEYGCFSILSQFNTRNICSRRS